MDTCPEFRRLAAAIILQAVADLRRGRDERLDAWLFLTSAGARELADLAELPLRPGVLAHRQVAQFKRGKGR